MRLNESDYNEEGYKINLFQKNFVKIKNHFDGFNNWNVKNLVFFFSFFLAFFLSM